KIAKDGPPRRFSLIHFLMFPNRVPRPPRNDFRSNHFQIVPRSDKNRHPGWPTLCEICKGWAPLHSDAEESKTHHGLRRPAFHYILLLSEKTLAGNGSSAKSCLEDP